MKRMLHLLLAALALLLVVPALLLLAAAVRLRHVPFAIPARDRPPASLALSQGFGAGGAPAALHAAREPPGLRLRYLGISGYELTDGRTVVLLDPTVTRPGLFELLGGPLRPDEALGARLCPRADFILVNHAHYDHALDVPAIALRTGATVLGSRSTCNLALSRGVPPGKVREVRPGESLALGGFAVMVRAARHARLLGSSRLLAGTIPREAGKLWFFEYLQDATLSFRLEAAGASVWFHPTSTYEAGELGGLAAGTLILGVTGERITPAKAAAIIAEAKPERVLPTHYDNFFQPLEKGLALLSEADLEAARRSVLAADPRLSWYVLEYGEAVRLPPDGASPP